MAYSFQTFSVNQILTAAQMNQVEVNIRDHVHGSASVVTVPTAGIADDAVTGAKIGTEAIEILGVKTSTTEVVSTAAETDVYIYAVAANSLGTTGSLILCLIGDVLQNTGAAQDWTIRVNWGAASAVFNSPDNFGTSANRRTIMLRVWLQAKGATNSQVLAFHMAMNDGSSYANATDRTQITSQAQDTTVAQNLTVTIQHGSALSTMSTRILSARVLMAKS